MDYDPDDPPPVVTWEGAMWYALNRAAENMLWYLRLIRIIRR